LYFGYKIQVLHWLRFEMVEWSSSGTPWNPGGGGRRFLWAELEIDGSEDVEGSETAAFCNDRFTSSDFSHRKFVVFPALAIGRPEDRRHPIPGDMYLAIVRLLQFEISPEYQDLVSPGAEDSGFHLGLIFRFSLKAD
jgi:hypothetical protein